MEFAFLHTLQGLHNGVLDTIMVGLSTLGNAGMIWVVLALCFLFCRKYQKCGAVMIVSLVMMLLICNVFLKNIVARDRPCWIDQEVELLVAVPKDYSFPSGHTYAGFTAACVMLHYHKREGIAATALAAAIAFSRLYLFVHFPTDVLGGVVLGILTAWVACKFVDWLENKRSMENEG